MLAKRSATEARIAAFTERSGLLVYLAVWVVGLGFGTGGAWLLAAGIALVYVGLMALELAKHDRAFLKGDRRAFPISFLAYSAAVILLALAESFPLEGKEIALAWAAFFGVFILAHFAAVLYATVVGGAARWVHRAEIREERVENGGGTG